jgi:VCBS repeat protein
MAMKVAVSLSLVLYGATLGCGGGAGGTRAAGAASSQAAFGAEAHYPCLTMTVGTSVVVADFDLDGNLDVAASAENGLYVLPGNGNGTLGPATSPPDSGYFDKLVTSDFNGDGAPDLAVGTVEGMAIMLDHPGHPFTVPASYLPGGFGYGDDGVAVGDVNGDGTPDLVGSAGESLVVAPVSRAGTLSDAAALYTSGTFFAIAAGDLNGDGKADVVVSGDGIVGVMMAGAGGALGPVVVYQVGLAEPSKLVVTDVTGDQIPDVVAMDLETDSVITLPGVGDGTLASPLLSPIPYNPRMILATGDVNGDGIADVVTALEDTLAVLLGQGDGTFIFAGTVGERLDAYDVALADVNNDGRLDIVVNDRVDVVVVLNTTE